MVTCGSFLVERAALRAIVRAEGLVTMIEPLAVAVWCGRIVRAPCPGHVDPTLEKPAFDLT
jgi:hypothetical protein